MKPKMRLRTLMVGFATTLASRNATNFHKEKDRVRASLPSRTVCIIPKFPSLWAAQNQKVKNASSRRNLPSRKDLNKTAYQIPITPAQSAPHGHPIVPSYSSYPSSASCPRTLTNLPSKISAHNSHPPLSRPNGVILNRNSHVQWGQTPSDPMGTDPIGSKLHFIK